MSEARHSRELLPSRWALDAAGYTLTTGFTTCCSSVGWFHPVWFQNQRGTRILHTVTKIAPRSCLLLNGSAEGKQDQISAP